MVRYLSPAGAAVLVTALAGLVFAAPVGAAARGTACKSWDVGGTWRLLSNGFHVTMTLTQTGTMLLGKATLPAREVRRAGYSAGTVGGYVKGSQLMLFVDWSAYVHIVYSGTLRKGGVDRGITYDGAQQNLKARWTGTGPARCQA